MEMNGSKQRELRGHLVDFSPLPFRLLTVLCLRICFRTQSSSNPEASLVLLAQGIDLDT